MNIPISESAAETFRTLSKAEWHDLFEDMRQSEYERIRAATETTQLTAIRERVNLMDELEMFILEAQQVSKPVRTKK